MPSNALIHVAVGVIYINHKVLVSQRGKNAHQGGLWEFPGGKVEVNESVEQALSRELEEELGIAPVRIKPLFCIRHDYSDKLVGLDIWLVDEIEGTPEGREGQLWQWIAIDKIDTLSFPAANQPIVDYLQSALFT